MNFKGSTSAWDVLVASPSIPAVQDTPAVLRKRRMVQPHYADVKVFGCQSPHVNVDMASGTVDFVDLPTILQSLDATTARLDLNKVFLCSKVG
jgi:hypothetical protein